VPPKRIALPPASVKESEGRWLNDKETDYWTCAHPAGGESRVRIALYDRMERLCDNLVASGEIKRSRIVKRDKRKRMWDYSAIWGWSSTAFYEKIKPPLFSGGCYYSLASMHGNLGEFRARYSKRWKRFDSLPGAARHWVAFWEGFQLREYHTDLGRLALDLQDMSWFLEQYGGWEVPGVKEATHLYNRAQDAVVAPWEKCVQKRVQRDHLVIVSKVRAVGLPPRYANRIGETLPLADTWAQAYIAAIDKWVSLKRTSPRLGFDLGVQLHLASTALFHFIGTISRAAPALYRLSGL